MNIKKISVIISLAVPLLTLAACSKSHHPGEASTSAPAEKKKILFYRNPMNAGVTSPVPAKDSMGMDYLPVYETGNEGTAPVPGRSTIRMSPDTEQRIGVTVATAEVRDLTLSIHAAARVAYDPQLYSALLEHREALAFLHKTEEKQSPDILEEAQTTARSSELRLRQLGLSESQIREMTQPGRDLSNLLLGSEGGSAWVYSDVYDTEASLIRKGQSAELSSPALPGETYRGLVETIDPILNSDTRTLRVRIRVPDPQKRLKPEMYLDAALRVALGEKLSVPSSAVIDTGARQLVYVQKEPGTYEARDVRLGRHAEGYDEIVAGIEKGDKVATSANFLIDSESHIQEATQKAVEQMGE
jgi:Cu(I)/Ag(I) efflux system membrane fusion protein